MNGIRGRLTPNALFEFLKMQVIYKDDPKNIELIQSMGTLFENNYHKIKGAGDCDCFTVTAMACLIYLGYSTGFLLYYNGTHPTHIAACYEKENGEIVPFDLTAGYCGELRRYKEVIPYMINL